MLNKKNANNSSVTGLILVAGINLMYPSVVSLIYLFGIIEVDYFPSIIGHQMLATLSLIALYYTPLLKIPTFKQVVFNQKYLYLLFSLCAIFTYLTPWSLDQTSTQASITAVFRALWLVFVWSRVTIATNKELKILAVLTLVLALLDGSRNYALLAFLGILTAYRASTFKKIGLVVLLPILMSFVHFVRVIVVEPSWNPSLFSALSEGFIGESYWGYYGLKQIKLSGDVFFLQDYLSTMLFPIFGFLKFLIGNYEVFDPGYFARLNVKQELGEGLFPMGGYVIHAQFIPLGPIIGNISLYVYLFLIRQVAALIFGKYRSFCHWAVIFTAIKASPDVVMSFCYFMAFYQTIAVFLGVKKIRWG